MEPRARAQDVMRCDLCKTDVVQMHCDACLVNLCTTCDGKHFSADLSKSHTIVDFKDRKSTPIYPRCTSHDKQQCTMHCNQCNFPVCIKCISSDQHLGHKVSEILEIVDEKIKIIIKEQIELNETIYPTYQDIASDVKIRMSQLEKEYGDLSRAITKHGEDLHREIDKLVEKIKAEVDEMKSTQLQTLQKHLDEINKNISDIRDEIDSIDLVEDSYNISKLFSITTNVDRYRNLPQKILPSLFNFTPGKINEEELVKMLGILSPSFLTSDKHGYSMKTTQKSPEAGSSPPVKQLLDEPQSATTIHTLYGKLLNVACLSDEEIWISGHENNTMKLYSIKQGSLLKTIRTKTWNTPTDIAVTNSGDLLYTDNNERTVNIVKNEKIQEVIRLRNWIPNGVCSTSSGDLLVIMYSDDYKQSKVVRYSDFTEKQTIQFDNKGKKLYSSSRSVFIFDKYWYITENKNLDICVSDRRSRAVVVVNQAGKLRFRYNGHTPLPKNKPFGSQGITTDSQRHILTADYSNHCVHIIDKNGHFLRYVDCGLSDPWGVCTDTNDNLFVAQIENRQVKKIQYLK